MTFHLIKKYLGLTEASNVTFSQVEASISTAEFIFFVSKIMVTRLLFFNLGFYYAVYPDLQLSPPASLVAEVVALFPVFALFVLALLIRMNDIHRMNSNF